MEDIIKRVRDLVTELDQVKERTGFLHTATGHLLTAIEHLKAHQAEVVERQSPSPLTLSQGERGT